MAPGTVTLTRLDPTGPDRGPLVDFMTSNTFPFHMVPRPTRAQVEEWIGEGAYRDEDNDSFWVEHTDLGRIGFFRLEDLTDDAPVFDLRLGEDFQGSDPVASVAYGILRRDWQTGTVTPFVWEDLQG